MDTRW